MKFSFSTFLFGGFKKKMLLIEQKKLKNELHVLVQEFDNKVTYYANHVEKLKNLNNIIEKVMALSKKVDSTNKNSQYIDWEREVNFEAFIAIAAMDLLVIRKTLFLSDQALEKVFFIKQAYLLVYETLQNYSEQSISIYNHIKNKHQHFEPAYKSLTEKIRTFKKNFGYDTTIKNIRNTVAAHRDTDLLVYYQTISMIDVLQGTQAIDVFIGILDDLREFHRKLFFTDKPINLKYEEIDQKMEEANEQIKRIEKKLRGILNQ